MPTDEFLAKMRTGKTFFAPAYKPLTTILGRRPVVPGRVESAVDTDTSERIWPDKAWAARVPARTA